MSIRTLKEEDYDEIISVLDEWWEGRHMTEMLPRLFFKHFNNTSFAIQENNKVIAFLIGFISQTHPNQAYVHFIGVHPEYRKKGLGLRLYHTFFDLVKQKGCNTVHIVTSPDNKKSIAFHTHIGFQNENYNINGITAYINYDGPGEDRVLLKKAL